jgi:hypothetical protein
MTRCVPAVVIELRIEAAPVVHVQTDSHEDFDRLADWIRANEPLHDLVIGAVALRTERGGVA